MVQIAAARAAAAPAFVDRRVDVQLVGLGMVEGIVAAGVVGSAVVVVLVTFAVVLVIIG